MAFFIEMPIFDLLQQRELCNKNFSKYSQQYIIYNRNACKNDHTHKYVPHTKYGTCRFCWGREPVTFQEFVKKIS